MRGDITIKGFNQFGDEYTMDSVPDIGKVNVAETSANDEIPFTMPGLPAPYLQVVCAGDPTNFWGIGIDDGKLIFMTRPDGGLWMQMNAIPPALMLYIDGFMTQFYHLLNNKLGITPPKPVMTHDNKCANITKNGDTTIVTPRL